MQQFRKRGDVEKARELINSFKNRHADGFIIAPSPAMEQLIIELRATKIPLLLFDSYFPLSECDHVITDNFKGILNCTTHLLENRYNSIGFATITIKTNEIQMCQRLDGFHGRIPFGDESVEIGKRTCKMG